MELSPQTEMETRMVALGVTKSQARKLYDSYSGEFLKLKIEEVEFLASKPDTIPKNPGGFLVRSLKEKYESPEGFKSAEQKERESASAESAKLKRLEREKNQQREAINNHLQLEYSRALVGEIEGALKVAPDRAALEKEFVEEIVPGDDYLREDFARKGIEGMMVKIQFHDFLNKHWKIEERFTFDEFMKRDGFVIEEGAKSCVLKRNGERVKVAMNW